MEARISTVSVSKEQNARMQLWTEGGRELFNGFPSIDILQTAELFVEDKFLRDLRSSLNSQQQQRKIMLGILELNY